MISKFKETYEDRRKTHRPYGASFPMWIRYLINFNNLISLLHLELCCLQLILSLCNQNVSKCTCSPTLAIVKEVIQSCLFFQSKATYENCYRISFIFTWSFAVIDVLVRLATDFTRTGQRTVDVMPGSWWFSSKYQFNKHKKS